LVKHGELAKKTLDVSVWDYDLGKSNDFIGESFPIRPVETSPDTSSPIGRSPGVHVVVSSLLSCRLVHTSCSFRRKRKN